MKRTQLWHCEYSILFFGLLVTSCAATITEGPGTAVSAPPPASLNTPSQSVPPGETCATFLPSAPCSPYASVSGTASGRALPWPASGAVAVQLTTVAGSLQLAVRTPCNPMDGAATITGRTLQAGKIAVGAMGCAGEAAAQEQWVLHFLQRPIEMTFSDGLLNWKSGPDTLTLKGK